MSAVLTSQNIGNVKLARASRRSVCSNVWISTSAFATVNFTEMTMPAYKHLGYGAGITHPNWRPQEPM